MSQTSICNRALALLGANRITSLADETPEAQSLANVYRESLRSVLEECAWSFALKRTQLNRLVLEPSWGGGHYFELPSDFVRLFEVDRDARYRIEGRYLATEATEIGILYVYMCEDPNVYTSAFTEALACKLAHDVCFDLTNNANRQTELLRLYKGEFLPVAKNRNSRDRTPPEVKDGLWASARFHGGGI